VQLPPGKDEKRVIEGTMQPLPVGRLRSSGAPSPVVRRQPPQHQCGASRWQKRSSRSRCQKIVRVLGRKETSNWRACVRKTEKWPPTVEAEESHPKGPRCWRRPAPCIYRRAKTVRSGGAGFCGRAGRGTGCGQTTVATVTSNATWPLRSARTSRPWSAGLLNYCYARISQTPLKLHEEVERSPAQQVI